jgi:hypothetical protein
MQRIDFNEGNFFRPLRQDQLESIRGMHHVPWHIVVDRLNRWFGPTRWNLESLKSPQLLAEEKRPDGKWEVCYTCTMRLVVVVNGERVEKTATGSFTATQGSRIACHEMASLSCESIAIKRCARNFGPAFGLQLYDGSGVKLPMGEVPIYADFKQKKEKSISPPPEAPSPSPPPRQVHSAPPLAEFDQQVQRAAELCGDPALTGAIHEYVRRSYDVSAVMQLSLQQISGIVDDLRKCNTPADVRSLIG